MQVILRLVIMKQRIVEFCIKIVTVILRLTTFMPQELPQTQEQT